MYGVFSIDVKGVLCHDNLPQLDSLTSFVSFIYQKAHKEAGTVSSQSAKAIR